MMCATLSSLATPFRPAARCGRCAAALLAFAITAAGCETFPAFTQNADSFSPEAEARQSAIEYQEILARHPLSQDSHHIQLVQQVGQRLAGSSGRTDVRWDFKLVEDQTPRVTALPGGRVIVADATLGICQNEAQLAAMLAGGMGRELARRSARDPHQDARSLQHNVEADSIALSMMVGAGYDPEAARHVWFRNGDERSGPASTQGTAQSRTTRHGSFLLALDRASFIYRSHPQPLGTGNPIAWQPRHNPAAAPTFAAASQDAWTTKIERGSAKPNQWNADLVEAPIQAPPIAARANEEFLPPKPAGGAIQPVVYEWSSSDEALVPVERRVRQGVNVAEPAEFHAPVISTPAALPGPLLP